MLGLNTYADVYIVNDVNGEYDILTHPQLPCRLAHIGVTGAAIDRAQLLSTRMLIWDVGYSIPDDAQVDVEGNRWQTVRGTFSTLKGPNNVPTYKRVDVVRVNL